MLQVKSGIINDYSVCTVWGSYDRHYYLLHVMRRKMNYPELKRAAIELAKQYGAHNVLYRR
jgi:phage terminase large subunit-like protein